MLTSGNDISNHWVQVPSKRRVLLMPSTKMKGKKKKIKEMNSLNYYVNSIVYVSHSTHCFTAHENQQINIANRV